MDTRKLQKVGGGTLTVSLPKKWVSNVNLKNRDIVSITTLQDGNLLLTPRIKEKEERKKVIEIEKEKGDELLRKLIGIYIAGYNIIEIKTQKRISPEIRTVIKEFVKKVIGLEITEEGANFSILQDLTETSDLPLYKSLRRMYNIARTMHTDAIISLKENDKSLAKDVIQRDDDVDRIYWLIAKQYNIVLKDYNFAEKVDATSIKGLNYLTIAKILERIADHSCKIAENSLRLETIKKEILEEIGNLSSLALRILDKSMSSLSKNDVEESNDAIELSKELQKAKNSLIEKILKEESKSAISLAYVIESIDRTGSYATDIAEIVINHVMNG